MSFKVKITMIGFLGNTDKYPCHFKHRPGDEIIFDGEKFIGRLCSGVWPIAIPVVFEVHKAGPRYIPSPWYYPFWYAPISVEDPNFKKYDGLGFRNILETSYEPKFHMANLVPQNAFKWPPHPERTVCKDPIVICGDLRTAAMFKIEAIDIADKGFHVPYYRRQMIILSKVLSNQGVNENKILELFSKEEIEGIYPALSQILINVLKEELELMGYLENKNGKVYVTKKGEEKLGDFRKNLTIEEKDALGL